MKKREIGKARPGTNPAPETAWRFDGDLPEMLRRRVPTILPISVPLASRRLRTASSPGNNFVLLSPIPTRKSLDFVQRLKLEPSRNFLS
jgi:hypothetical protein